MAETNVAASSPAEQTDPFGGIQPTFDEYSSYRKSGELPARFKPAGSTAVEDAPEKTADMPADEESETVPESDPEEVQEPPAKTSEAQKRILQLLAENKRLKQEAAAKPGVKTESPTAQAAQQPQGARPKPNVSDMGADGKPKYAQYEEYIEDLADWKAEQHLERFKVQQAKQVEAQQLRAKIEEGKAIYGDDFGDVSDEAAGVIGNDKDVPQLIKQRIGRSELLPHLLYTIAGEENGIEKLTALAKSDPFKALDYIALTENLIREELAKGKTGGEEDEDGKAPEKKRTNAPKPPSPVGGPSSRAFDVSDDSLSADEWARRRTAQLEKRKKG